MKVVQQDTQNIFNNHEHGKIKAWVQDSRTYTNLGKCANYIPALERANPSQLGICIIDSNGSMVKTGDFDTAFTLQSISKVIGFIAACIDYGISYVLERVDVEPTGMLLTRLFAWKFINLEDLLIR